MLKFASDIIKEIEERGSIFVPEGYVTGEITEDYIEDATYFSSKEGDFNLRAEHNCHLCKKEWLGRCFGSKHYGIDVSVNDTPVCDEYEFGGSQEKLEAIQKAEVLGVTEL